MQIVANDRRLNMAKSKSFSQLILAEQISINDLLAISIPNSDSYTGFVSRKASLGEIASSIVSDFQFSTELETTNKTIVGAINEAKAQSDYLVTGTASDIIEDILTGVTVEQFSAAVTPATVTICCRLTFETGVVSSSSKLFGLKAGYGPLVSVPQIVNTNARISNETQVNRVQILQSGFYYQGTAANATYIEIATTYPRKQS